MTDHALRWLWLGIVLGLFFASYAGSPLGASMPALTELVYGMVLMCLVRHVLRGKCHSCNRDRLDVREGVTKWIPLTSRPS